MTSLVPRTVDCIEAQIVSHLQDLLRFPSITGEEGPIQGYIASFLEDLGLDVDMWEPKIVDLESHPAYTPGPEDYSHRPNVVATLRGSGGGRSLLLNGHVDVIPPGIATQWSRSPWSGELAEGRIHGRGASDMKSGIAAMTMAVASILKSGVSLKGDVILEYTVDEELTGNGSLACVLRGYRANAGICCETSSLRVQPASIGRIWFEISVQGRAAGIQRQWEGVNALDKGYLIHTIIADFEKARLSRQPHPLYPDLRSALPCQVGVFEAGSYPSALPSACQLRGSMATLPDESSDVVKKEFSEFILSRTRDDLWLRHNAPKIEFTGYFAQPSEIPRTHAIVRSLSSQYRAVVGEEPVISGREGAADSRFLNEYGDTPTVIFGPGLTEQMHAVDEWVPVENVARATKILALTILDWCGYG